ncbi:MAG TPA: hypothetical protein VFS25_16490 [Chitinophaga sp.]|uniref:hypothetical protein n=1 Tax=Chitinophaga sp. TaxID=1869181 RepID=UPI002DB7A10F|nr:hypothetical protein [Chitinophaga sp.]HEU4554446.1 hypothetical protein [Chitinophaga sp.]
MQKILWTVGMVTLILFVQSQARAQQQMPFKKNLVGGSLSFSTSSEVTPPSGGGSFDGTSFSFRPTYIHYLKENLGIGATLAYNRYSTDNPNELYLKYAVNAYGFRPFIRFDIPLWQSRFSVFNDVGIGGNYSALNMDLADGTHTRYNTWSLEAFYNPGLMFRLKRNISLQVSFASFVNYTYVDEGHAHSFGITPNHGINDLVFGVNFLF